MGMKIGDATEFGEIPQRASIVPCGGFRLTFAAPKIELIPIPPKLCEFAQNFRRH
jgi:hypothetical protein